jgi:hypothetical protein
MTHSLRNPRNPMVVSPEPFRGGAERRGETADNLLLFGDQQYVFPPNVKRVSVFNTDAFMEEVCRRLKDMAYDPDYDFIVLRAPITQVILIVTAALKQTGTIKVLIYDPPNTRFVERLLHA